MAQAHAVAIESVRDIEKLIIFSIDPDETKKEFIKSLEKIIKSEICIASSVEEAVKNADIVTLITTAKNPVINGNWLKPGTHINGAGSHEPARREIDTGTVLRSKVVCDLIDACRTEAGDLIIPVEEKKWSWDKVHASLGDIITRKKAARESDEEITLFKTVGLAVQDVSVALHVYNKAVEMNAGLDFDF
jgi:ornithine cyclodeaminase/alanine dehydrogenase-like protein (mu-crystallin family)